MAFEKLLEIFKNIFNFDELTFVLIVIKRNNLDLINKHSGYINGYDFESLTGDSCLAMKYGSGIVRKIKYKNISKNFELKNPKNIEKLDISYIKVPETLKNMCL